MRVGRQDVKLGQEVLYPEPNWRYLKTARLGERLVGTVGWSHVERAYDGASAGWNLSGVQLYGFGARPTTGVFDAESGKNLWQGDLKLAFGTAPVVYSIDGTQYILVTIGGAALTASEELGEIGARVVALKLGGKDIPPGPALK